MIVISSFDQIPPLKRPIALTIGMFDGVHRGHQYLLAELKKHGTAVVLTFSNHPASILKPQQEPTMLLPMKEKLQLFEEIGIATTILIPFTKELAHTPYDQFLSHLRAFLPFSTLVGGEDMGLGYGRKGDMSRIEQLSKELQFETMFLPRIKLYGEIISSSQIRSFIKNHQYDQAAEWLGHSKGIR